MRFSILALFVFALFSSFELNKITNNPIFKIPYNGHLFINDNLENLYIVNKNSDIIKYSAAGEQKAKVNFKYYGKLESLDVSNPFEIYAFYKEQQTLLILDNMLSTLAVLDLKITGLGQIGAACRSFDNGIWLYDATQTKLYKYDKTLKQQVESLPFASWATNIWDPHYIVDNQQQVIMLDSNNGVVLFDEYGNYYKELPFITTTSIQVNTTNITYLYNSYLVRYNYKFFKSDSLKVKPQTTQLQCSKTRCYELLRDTLVVY